VSPQKKKQLTWLRLVELHCRKCPPRKRNNSLGLGLLSSTAESVPQKKKQLTWLRLVELHCRKCPPQKKKQLTWLRLVELHCRKCPPEKETTHLA